MKTQKKQPMKQKVTRVTALLDEATGEKIPVVQVSQEIDDRDFNFHKIWFGHFIQSLDTITSQRLKLAFWIIDHLDSNNKLTMTQRQISELSGVSLKTVAFTMKALQEGELPFLQKINNGGAYMVNPNVIFKGNAGKRMAVMYDYSNMKSPSNSPKEKTVTDINTAKKSRKPRSKKASSKKEKTA